MTDAYRFLTGLHGDLRKGESVELRIKAATTKQVFFDSTEGAAKAALLSSESADVYYGIATRDGKGGKKGNIVRIPCAWADLDTKGDLQAPVERLNASPLVPSVIVNSGGGLHCYWLFGEPVFVGDVARVEKLNIAIAKSLGGDSVHDASRVLRVPGTLNHKYDPPADVVLMRLEPTQRYSLEQLESAFAVASETALLTEAVQPAAAAVGNSGLPCRQVLWAGVEENYRNNTCFQLGLDLKRQGIPEDGALRILSDWNKQNKPPMDPPELGNTVASAYSTDYTGLGCDNHPMSDFCTSNCPVKNKATTERTRVAEDAELVPTHLPVWTWSALLKRESTPVEFIVEGLIPRRGVTLLTGEGGIGKSFAIIDLAYSVGSGSDFLHYFKTVEGPVLVIDLENDDASIARRVQKITAGRRESDAEAEDIPVYVLKKGELADARLNIDDEKGKRVLCDAIESYCPVLLVLDPLVAVHSEDENDNMGMRRVIMQLQEIARRYDLAVVVIHHPRKRGMINDGGQMIRGASDLRNAVDSHLFMRKVTKEQAIVEHDKSRHAPPIAKFTIEMVDSEDGTATYIRYTGATTETLEKEAAARECLLSILQDGECQRKDLLGRAAAEGVSKSTAERALNGLVAEKRVQNPERGLYRLMQAALDLEA